MATQEFPAVNGQKHSYADVVIAVGGRKFRGISSISYKASRGMTDVHGTGPNRVGVALGKVANEGSLEMYREDFQDLLDAIGDGYSNVPLQVMVAYRVRIGARLLRDTLNGVRIKEFDLTAQEGDDPIKVKAALNIGEIIANGKRIA